jgi:hypothetical protein
VASAPLECLASAPHKPATFLWRLVGWWWWAGKGRGGWR